MTGLLRCLDPRPMARRRLVIFPYAGAGAGPFAGWPAALPRDVEPYVLTLPGRDHLLSAPLLTDWAAMVSKVIQAIEGLRVLPIAFYGHSLGAELALAVARALSDRMHLDQMFVAARPWPGENMADKMADLDVMDDDILLSWLTQNFGALPASFENKEIREALLPALRADIRLMAQSDWPGPAGLSCPFTVYAGQNDPATAGADLDGWAMETSATFRILKIPAGHYFTDNPGMMTDLSRALSG